VIAALNAAAVMGCLSSYRLLYNKVAFSVKKVLHTMRQCTVPSVNMVALTIIVEQRIMTFSQLDTELLS